MSGKAVLILGSTSDEVFAEKITNKLSELDVPFDLHVASAHKQPKKVLEVIES